MDRRTLLAALTALLVSSSPALVRAQGVQHPEPESRFAAAISQTRAHLAEHAREHLPGLSVAVGVEGRLVWAEGFGWADLEQRVPVTPLTRFRIGSVSKPLTAAALGLLVERGELDLDAPVQEYVPDFPTKRWPITTRQVAGHVAGIRHYQGLEFRITRHYRSVEKSLSIFEDDPLLFEPGTKFSYSSYGWNLVSAVIEGAGETSFLEFMQREVFDELGLQHTVADQNQPIVPYRARPYMRSSQGELINATYVDNSYKWAGGGFLSTPGDMVRFGLAHLTGSFLAEETRELLFTSQTLSSGEETGNGIGWFVRHDGDRPAIWHGGGSVGGTTQLRLFPRTGVVVALVTNLSSAKLPAAAPIAAAFGGAGR